MVCCSTHAAALVWPLTALDIHQALAISRSPAPVRAQFHSQYTAPLDITIDYIRLDRLEVMTEFRRLEVIGEHHERLKNFFGRGDLRDAREALRPWTGRVSLAIHLTLLPTTRYITGLPALQMVLAGPAYLRPTAVRPTPLVTEEGAMIGGVIEYDFDSGGIGQRAYQAVVALDGRELVRVSIDFSKLR